MAALSRTEIIAALKRLGEFADERGALVRLVVVGGAFMALAFDARQSTKDVDAVAEDPETASLVRALAARVADELGWPADWLNDGAKGYLVGLSPGPVLFSDRGIEVRSPSLAQLLAMKLAAWRDDVDVADASLLLRELRPSGDSEKTWESLRPFLPAGSELKAQYAFLDLWEALDGSP